MTGYAFVYSVEIVLLVGTLIALGPLVRSGVTHPVTPEGRFGLTAFPI